MRAVQEAFEYSKKGTELLHLTLFFVTKLISRRTIRGQAFRPLHKLAANQKAPSLNWARRS